jgi:hypothetical protein
MEYNVEGQFSANVTPAQPQVDTTSFPLVTYQTGDAFQQAPRIRVAPGTSVSAARQLFAETHPGAAIPQDWFPTINGRAAQPSDELQPYETLSFSEPAKRRG